MDERDYRELFDSLAPGDALLAHTEREAEKMMNRRTMRRAVRTTVIVVLAILLTVGVALAATFHSRILDMIFPKSEPSQAALDALRTDAGSVSEDGLTLNVDELLMDGNSLSCTWTVTSSRAEDVYYLTYYDLDDGGAADSQLGVCSASSSNDVGDVTLVRLVPGNDSYSGNFRMVYEALPDEPVQMTLRIYAFTTDLIPVEIGDAFDLIHADEGDPQIAELESKDEIAYDGAQLCSVWAYGAVQRAYEALLAGGAGDEMAEIGALAQSGLMDELTTLTLTVSPDADEALPEASFRLKMPKTFRLSDRTVVINRLNLDVASTTVQYDIYPDALPAEQNLLNGFRYLLFDQDGNLLDVDYSLNLDINTNLEYDGDAWKLNSGEEAPKLSVTVSGNPLPEGLTSIRFVPTCALQRNEGESANAYYGRMAALADDADTFVIGIK